MDLHALSRRDLQALAKRNGVKANMTNAAMADALAKLPKVDGIEEYVQQPVPETASAAEPEVQAAAAEEEEKETAEEEEEAETKAEEEEDAKEEEKIPSHEVIMLDDSEEEEKAPALSMGRRRATRRAQIEPVAAPATRRKAAASKAEKGDAAAEAVPAPATMKKAAASKAEKGDAAAEAVPTRATRAAAASKAEKGEEAVEAAPATMKKAAESKAEKGDADAEAVPTRATRARGKKTVSWAEEEAPKGRPTTRRAAARKTSTEQEEEEEGTQSGVSDAEAAVPAPASSDEGVNGAEDMDAVTDAQNEEQPPAAEAQKGDAAAEAVPARATRGRGRRTVVSVPEEEVPKTRRTSRRSMAIGDVYNKETAAPAPVSSNEPSDAAEEMEVAIDAHNEEENEAVEEPVEAAEPPVAVPARTTRGRSKRTVVSVADEEAPMARRTSRRAGARNSSTEQEEQEKGAQGDVSDMEVAVPAPVSSEEGGHDAEEMEAAMDVQNEELTEAAEAVPVRATRGRSKRTVVSVAEEEAPKARRTSRRAEARRTNTEQEEEEKGTQGDVSDMGAAVSAPTSSDEGGAGAEEIEASADAQKEEQFAAAVAVPARATRARRQRAVVSVVAEEEAPKARRTSRRTGTKQEEKVQQDIASDVEAAVPAPVSSDVGSDGTEEMEANMESLNELVEEDEVVVADRTPLLEEEEPVAEDCPVDSSVQEQADSVSSEEIQQSCEDTEMLPVQDVAEENEDCTAEEEPAVTEHVDSSVQEPLVDVQQCKATEEIQLASEDAEMERPQATLTSGEAAEEADFTSDGSEEAEDCTVEEETPVADDADSSVQELLLEVQQCEAIEEIHFATEDAEMVSVEEVPQATLTASEVSEEAEFTSHVDHPSEENEDCKAEEEPAVEEHVDSSVQELLVDVQQCEDAETEEIHLATEDAEMVPVDKVPQADFTSDGDHQSEEPEDCTVEEELAVAEDVQQCEATEVIHLASEETEDCTVEEELAVTVEADFTSDGDHQSEEPEDCTVEEELAVAEDVQQCEATEVIHLASEETEDCTVEEELAVAEDVQQCEATEVIHLASEEKEDCMVEEEPLAEDAQQCDATEDVHLAVEDTEMVHVNEVLQATLNSGEVTKEVDFTSDAGEENEVPTYEEVLQSAAKASEKKQDMAAEEETLVATDEMPQMSEAMDVGVVEVVTVHNLFATVTDEESDFSCDHGDVFVEEGVVAEDPSVEEQHDTVPSEEIQHSNDESGEATWEVDFTSDVGEETEDCTVEQEPPAQEDVDTSVQELLVDVVEQCQNSPVILGLVEQEGNNTTEEVHSPSEDTEMVPVNDAPEATLTSCEAAEEVCFSSENALQSAAEASKEKEDMVAVEVQQWSDAMYEEVVEVVAVDDKDESWFSPDLTAVFMDEEAAVADDEMPQSSATMEENVEDVVAVKESGFAGDQADVSVQEEEVEAADEMAQSSATVDEAVAGGHTPVVTTARDFSNHITSPFSANVFECLSMDSISVKQSGFTGKLMDMSVEEQGVVAAEEMPQSSATMEENVEEEVTFENLPQVTVTDEMPQSSATMEENVEEEVTFENLPQVTVTDDEWAVTLSAWLENMSQVKEMFTFDNLLQATLTEEAAVAADEMPHSSATKEENVEEVVAVENLSQAKESGVLQPVVDHTASDHTPSPQSANVFQYATKYLSSMDSVSVKPTTVSEPAEVPLCVYSRSVRKLKITEPMSVQRAKEVKVAKKPLGSVSVRKLKMKLKVDDAPLCIYSNSGDENTTSEAQESEALGSRSLRKLRTEFNEIVARENEVKEGQKSSTPLNTLSLRQLKQRLKETLNAQNHKNAEQPTRVPLGRLDENAW